MKIVVSPAKSLDFETNVPTQRFTQADFLAQSERIQNTLKKKSAKSLSKLITISESLGQLNYERNQAWHLPFDLKNARQALYTFNGDVYLGLNAYSLPLEKLDAVQQKVRILSGLYGLLKPLDLIQPYRLEMGTKLKIGTKENLYKYWQEPISKALNKEMKPNEVLINLASYEYFKAVDTKILNRPIITPIFQDLTKGKLKVVSFFAKRARGLMLRYIIDNDIDTTEPIKNFNCEGYTFDSKLSNNLQLVFTR